MIANSRNIISSENLKNQIKNIESNMQAETSNICNSIAQIEEKEDKEDKEEKEENKFDDKPNMIELCDDALLLEEQVSYAHNRESELNQYYDVRLSNNGLRNSNNLVITSGYVEKEKNAIIFPSIENQNLQSKLKSSYEIQSYQNNTFINDISSSSESSSVRSIIYGYKLNNKNVIN